jgi:hypothetical protein
VSLGGISGDEFSTISKTKKPYLKAGERRYDFSAMVYGGGKKTYDAKGNLIPEWKNSDIKLAAAVPRQTLNFTLFIGDYPPLEFKAEEQVPLLL